MRAFRRRQTAKEWIRLGLKFGLLATDGRVWAAMNDRLREQADDVRAVIRRKYEESADQLASTRAASRPTRDWLARATNLLAGAGIGVGLGILLAPASGQETRAALRDKAAGVNSSLRDIAARATGVRSRAMGSPSTGTRGD